MYEIDFLAVGKKAGDKCGDAIALRFVPAGSTQWAQVVIDAGFKDDGKALVEHVNAHYDRGRLDLAILTHPDEDHINGMGEVLRGLSVKELWLHRIGAHGGSSLDAADAVEDLISVASEQGTAVYEVFAGQQAFGGALTVIGPDQTYYEQLVAEQVSGVSLTAAARKAAVAAGRSIWDRLSETLGQETPFPEKEVTPRNNSSIITLLTLDDQRLLLTGDAGVPALSRAWNFAEANGLAGNLAFIQVPHHGSRRNASSAFLDRLIGQPGQTETRSAFVSVSPGCSHEHPSGRVINAYERRGCRVIATAGEAKCSVNGVPLRDGWVPATPLGPMVEEPETEG
ncbi:MAG: ComEC/Rec2 family competence protein [Solirubrobacterales bacterium]